MNRLKYIALCLIFMTGCKNKNTQEPHSNGAENLAWLEGTWNRVGTAEVGHERWQKVSAEEWKGWGVTFKGIDTSFVEKIRIVKKDNNLFYVADVPENPEPVYFKFTSLEKNGFTCENPAHDFPKKIEYSLTGSDLSVTISGDGKSIPFDFQKQP